MLEQLRRLFGRPSDAEVENDPQSSTLPAPVPPRPATGRIEAGLRRAFAGVERCFALTDTGNVRANNEDNYYLSGDGRFLVVADGMGGHDDGELASTLACEAMAAHYQSTASTHASAQQLLVEAFARAQDAVWLRSQERDSARPMGTTLVAALREGESAVTVAHIGDARAYIATKDALTAITGDHSVVAELVRDGRLSAEEAREHPYRNHLTRAVGLPDGFEPDVGRFELTPGSYLLLCSDGLWDTLAEDELCAIVGESADVCDMGVRLADAAVASGAPDNLTIVLFGPARA